MLAGVQQNAGAAQNKCIKNVKIVKKPSTKLMKLHASGDDDDNKNAIRSEFVRYGEQTLSSSSGSTGENDRMSEKSEWNAKSCDADTDVAHFARMQCEDDVVCHVVKNKDLELDMSVALSVVHMFDELETTNVIIVSDDGHTDEEFVTTDLTSFEVQFSGNVDVGITSHTWTLFRDQSRVARTSTCDHSTT